MSTARVVTLVVGGCLAAVWLAASAGAWLMGKAGTAVRPELRADSPAGPSAGAAGALAVRPLDAPNPAPARRPGRNLFEIHDRAGRSVEPTPRSPEVVVPPAALEPAPAPTVTLIGVATSGEGDGVVRTAVVSGAGQLWLAREGAVVAGRYRVDRVGTDEVELRDTVLNTRHTLRLR